jgi:ribonucleoside-diphosphate reductase alpha chain
VLSCPDAIARAIEEALEEDGESAESFASNKCPDCGSFLSRQEGCSFCVNGDCGYFKCG